MLVVVGLLCSYCCSVTYNLQHPVWCHIVVVEALKRQSSLLRSQAMWISSAMTCENPWVAHSVKISIFLIVFLKGREMAGEYSHQDCFYALSRCLKKEQVGLRQYQGRRLLPEQLKWSNKIRMRDRISGISRMDI